MEVQQIEEKKQHYRNDWFLRDLSDISKTILNVGKSYRTYAMLHKDDRRISNSNDLTKLFYLLYLTASRIGEPLKKPFVIRKSQLNGYVIIHIDKINEKHFDSNGEYKMMSQNIPIDNEADREMWDFILEAGLMGNEKKLDMSPLGGYEKRTEITNKFKYNFKADLTDGEHIYKQAGIAPHILRHLRVYNLRFNTYPPLRAKGYEESLVQSYLGWSSSAMFEEYLYISKQIKDEEQLRILGNYLNSQNDIPKPKLTDLFQDTS